MHSAVICGMTGVFLIKYVENPETTQSIIPNDITHNFGLATTYPIHT